MAKQQSVDHHFVPQFYLKRWTGLDARVCEFSRPHKTIRASRKTPKATGFMPCLYTVPDLPLDKQSVLEDVVLKKLDQVANDALNFMIGNVAGKEEMPNKLRSGWSRFLMSLMHRSPEQLATLKAKVLNYLPQILPGLERDYLNFKEVTDPDSFTEMAAILEHDMTNTMWAKLFESVIDNPRVGLFLNTMKWTIATVGNSEHRLLTSDHPLVVTNGIEHPQGYVILPVGPDQIFIAVNTAEMAAVIPSTDPKTLVKDINRKIVEQAVRYVYDTDDRQQRFVENRLRHA